MVPQFFQYYTTRAQHKWHIESHDSCTEEYFEYEIMMLLYTNTVINGFPWDMLSLLCAIFFQSLRYPTSEVTLYVIPSHKKSILL